LITAGVLAVSAFLGLVIFLAALGIFVIAGAVIAIRFWLLQRRIDTALKWGASPNPRDKGCVGYKPDICLLIGRGTLFAAAFAPFLAAMWVSLWVLLTTDNRPASQRFTTQPLALKTIITLLNIGFLRIEEWSGRPGSNRRRSAWEADILPLNYSRV
jgi:hypothetical protein